MRERAAQAEADRGQRASADAESCLPRRDPSLASPLPPSTRPPYPARLPARPPACDYYLRCMSRPIIEHCDALRFAPYGLSFEGLQQQLVEAALERPTRADMWRCVDDFGWLRVQKSPHWSVLPPALRVGAAAPGAPMLPAAATERGLSVAYGETGEEADERENDATEAGAGAGVGAAGAAGGADAAKAAVAAAAAAAAAAAKAKAAADAAEDEL